MKRGRGEQVRTKAFEPLPRNAYVGRNHLDAFSEVDSVRRRVVAVDGVRGGTAASPKPPITPFVPGLADSSRLRAPHGERGVSGVGANYRLSEGDELEVAVLGVDELHRSVRVSERGRITLPLIPPVHVQGLTLDRSSGCGDEGSPTVMQDPIVDLSIVERKRWSPSWAKSTIQAGFPLEGFDETITDLLARAAANGARGPNPVPFHSRIRSSGCNQISVASTKTSGLIREVSFAKQAAIESISRACTERGSAGARLAASRRGRRS